MTEIERYIAPDNLAEAVQAMAGGGVTVVAGGTDLTPQIAAGQRQYQATLMNIRRMAGLSEIAPAGDEIRIGALATVSEVRRNELIAAAAPVLCDAGGHFASEQIRNAATIGGNLCNASPAGDMIIPLLVLGADVELARWQDGAVARRRVALAQFFTGPGRSVKQDDELLTAVIFARPAANFVGGFRKSGPRPALEISTVSVGIGGEYKDGALSNVRVALGAVGPTPVRAQAAEAALEGEMLTPDTIRSAAQAAQADASPIDDIRASAWYRNHLVGVFTEELLQNVCQN